jgi:hypothetical protein
MPAELAISCDLRRFVQSENGRYYCAFGRSNRSRAAWSGDNSISCILWSTVARATVMRAIQAGSREFVFRAVSWTSTRRRGPKCWLHRRITVAVPVRNSPPTAPADQPQRTTSRKSACSVVQEGYIACMHALTNQRFACKPCCHAAKSHTATRALGPRSGPGASEWRYQRTSTG